MQFSRVTSFTETPSPQGGAVMMRGLMPWTGTGSMKSELDRWFDRLVELKCEEFPGGGDWAPSMDISETKDSLVAKVEVPGMDQKDIQISLQENLLTIKGEKRQEKEEKDERYHRGERSYGAFTRSVRLPVGVAAGKVVATFKNGLLTVTLPKTPSSKGTMIPIKAE
jgi:HSP20 family protein